MTRQWTVKERISFYAVVEPNTDRSKIDCAWFPVASRISDKQDARLIAAAPDLLDACLSILNVEGAAKTGSQCKAWEGLDTKYHFDKIRAAIARATGSTD